MRPKRKYHINEYGIISSFMFAHFHSCGWGFAVLVYDAWKFSSTLKERVGICFNGDLDDYLIVECVSYEEAEQFCNALPLNMPRVSIWENGRECYDSIRKEDDNG